MISSILFGLFGLSVLISIAWLFSNNKRSVDWRLVLTGVALQIAFAALVLRVPGGKDVFDALGHGFVRILGFVNAGSNFIFGGLMNVESYGFIFAFQVLPTIIFFAALMGVLYHLGVMQFVVRVMAWAITKVMKVSGAETTSVCASVFIGQTEAPLTVRPYIPKMTESELITMMIGGMAHIAGGVLAAYVGMLGGGDPIESAYYAKHLLAASIMAAPATLVIAKLLIPETGNPLTRGTVKMEVEKTTTNVIDAAAAGAGDGLRLALNIGAMLLAFIALIALLNWPLSALGALVWSNLPMAVSWGLTALAIVFGAAGAVAIGNALGLVDVRRIPSRKGTLGALAAGGVVLSCALLLAMVHSEAGFTINSTLSALTGDDFTLSLEAIFGYVLAPIAWVIGVPWQDATVVGSLIGQKIVLNEFVAYGKLAEIVNGNVEGVVLTEQGKLIATYALCGFANFSSIAIQIGGIGGLAPERRQDLAKFGLRAVLGGTLATLMTATIAGVLTTLGG
jgi:CNT family concentrative nucleoside transporter